MDDIWITFAKSLATIGPVGVTALAAWYLWLRYGRAGTTSEKLTGWHEENRDAIRDTYAATQRIEVSQKNELDLMRLITVQIERTATILERMEPKVGRR